MTRTDHHPARGLLAGAAAGAAGTTALNAVTYLDMAVRGRPASSTPEETVKKISAAAGVTIPGDEQTRANRVAGLGPLSGVLVGVGTAAALGALRSAGVRPGLTISTLAAAAAAMIAGDAPMTALGITDPRSWDARAWLSDVIPHLAYGAVAAAVLHYLDAPG
jgi:hypothetical protein